MKLHQFMNLFYRIYNTRAETYKIKMSDTSARIHDTEHRSAEFLRSSALGIGPSELRSPVTRPDLGQRLHVTGK